MEAITPLELKARLDAGEELVMLDVREPGELEICAIPGSLHLPLGELTRRYEELEPQATIVCICHHGIRSASAAAFLSSREFGSVINLTGGVDRWAAEVDGAMGRY